MNSTLSLIMSALALAKQAAPLLPAIAGNVKQTVTDIEKLETDAPNTLKDPGSTIADVEKLFEDVATPISTVLGLIQGSKSIKMDQNPS